ncbi:metalloregulator ArsR/SmtB family transcription factor [Corynebacterium sp. H128]|uniref:ArsR/SmtB family transcription factor n=1 Tax=unclassified Corynebacterium TaxID=2624378 RepID=UPI00309A49DF
MGCCSLCDGPLSAEDSKKYAMLFKVLSDPVRLQLLSEIEAAGCGPLSVTDLVSRTDLSQPTVSHHLKKLSDAGLLRKVREGRTVTHVMQPEVFQELQKVLSLD